MKDRERERQKQIDNEGQRARGRESKEREKKRERKKDREREARDGNTSQNSATGQNKSKPQVELTISAFCIINKLFLLLISSSFCTFDIVCKVLGDYFCPNASDNIKTSKVSGGLSFFVLVLVTTLSN